MISGGFSYKSFAEEVKQIYIGRDFIPTTSLTNYFSLSSALQAYVQQLETFCMELIQLQQELE